MAWVVLLATLSTTGFDGAEPDKRTLQSILKGLYAPRENISCEYEGRMTFPQEQGNEEFGPDGLYDQFSGVYARRADGVTLVDIYHRYYPEVEVTRETIAMTDDTCEEYIRFVSEPRGGGEITPPHFKKFDRSTSAGRIFCDGLLLGYLNDDEWEMSNQKSEVIDGHECLVVTFTRDLSNGANPDAKYVERVWIGLGRGGHPLKREVYLRGGYLANRMDDVALQQFEDRRGTKIWLPISGVYESFGIIDDDGEVSFGSRPTNYERYDCPPREHPAKHLDRG